MVVNLRALVVRLDSPVLVIISYSITIKYAIEFEFDLLSEIAKFVITAGAIAIIVVTTTIAVVTEQTASTELIKLTTMLEHCLQLLLL